MRLFALILSSSLMAGCADSARLERLEAEIGRLSAEIQQEQQQTEALKNKLVELATQEAGLNQRLDRIREDIARLREAYPVTTRCVLDDIGLTGAMTSVLSDKPSEQLGGLIRAGVCLLNTQTDQYALVKEQLLYLQPPFNQLYGELQTTRQEQFAAQDGLTNLARRSVINAHTARIHALNADKACELDTFCRLKSAWSQ